MSLRLMAVLAALIASTAAWAGPVTVRLPLSVRLPLTVRLYDGPAPGSEHATQKEVWTPSGAGRIIRNVTEPTLTIYGPEGMANGTGIIILPGGGFHILAIDNEGVRVAQWLAAHGVTAFVVKYRVNQTSPVEAVAMSQMMTYLDAIKTAPDGLPPVTQGESWANADAVRAITLVRAHARDWGVDPHRIGVVGFSAGALLTLSLATTPDAAIRPDFAAPIYGALRPGLRPGAEAPPLFIAAATDDQLLRGRSVPIYQAWVAARRPAELHLYDHGGHGFGMQHQGATSDHWIDDFAAWLAEHDWLARAPES